MANFCTRIFEWDSAHRVLNHASKCKVLHGHRYRAEVTVTTPELDDLGFVIDFGLLKTLVGAWIDENWDHKTILNPADPLLSIPTFDSLVGAAVFRMDHCNPTAENMARYLGDKAQEILSKHDQLQVLDVYSVRLYETPNCYAEYLRPFGG